MTDLAALVELAERATDDLNDRAGVEWEALRLLSFHGAPWNPDEWLADLTREDVDGIAALINELAASRRAFKNGILPLRREVERLQEALEEIARLGDEFTAPNWYVAQSEITKVARTALDLKETPE